MRKLTRGPNAPDCLAQYHCDDPWKPSNAEKDEIWRELNAMQNHRCAYCEADIILDSSVDRFVASIT